MTTENDPPVSNASDVAPSNSARRTRPLRLLAICAGAILATYLIVCAAIFFWQERLIYFPTRDYWSTPAGLALTYEDITLTTDDGRSLAAWYLPHSTPKGTIVFFHGNGGNMAESLQTLKCFHRLGYSTLAFDYRGYGRSDGTPDEDGTYRDAEAAWRYLVQTRGVAPEDIVLFGRSLGGAVAIELATRHRPRALVVESTFTSLVAIGKSEYPFLPVTLLCTNRYESIKKVPGILCPKLFIHSTGDEIVPFEQGQRLFAAAAEPKRFLETPGGHNSGGFEYNPKYTQRLGQWLADVSTPQ